MSEIKEKNTSAEVEEMFNENSSTKIEGLAPAPKKRKGPKIFLTIILLLVVVFVVLLVISKTTNWNVLGLSKTNQATEQIDVKASDWQAVFLTNGQVYFGKLKKHNDSYPTLEDIYYLQVQEVPIQPALPATEEEGVQPAQQTQEQIILVKFGTELHRPMDKMYINKDHILMFEDLAQDSNVVEAIEGYKEQQEGE
ncbi:hypothetical protein ACFL1Y_00235 [Patescibacteria group bacterium]